MSLDAGYIDEYVGIRHDADDGGVDLGHLFSGSGGLEEFRGDLLFVDEDDAVESKNADGKAGVIDGLHNGPPIMGSHIR